ncbi:hypothetical protein NLG97_g9972 [Lecanicillium saksenae]|uniref:Uncharacterized protein n=1 Tax=Lecanicillium saksenae TaxID=468837 RepID=A0ACC1QG68_9HYPO|nr:hypothetical protein NLG97_g9972 [Lecanicillium saksenae]
MHAAYQIHEAVHRPHRTTRRQDSSYTVRIYFNVITVNDTLKGGNVPQETIDDQLEILNAAYENAGFTFVADDAVYTENEDWRKIVQRGDNEYAMMSSLRQGDYSELNIYITTIAPEPDGSVTLAYATLPDKASERAFQVDGIVLDANTLPGVAEPPYNKGITLVHEAGHWLGLLHTFERGNGTAADDELAGCKGDGDFVQDTPAEASAAFGCQIDRDTCTGQLEEDNTTSDPGPDPIHNYMDYGDDECLNTFTDGQAQRMQTAYLNSRINYEQGDDDETFDPEPPGPPHGG